MRPSVSKSALHFSLGTFFSRLGGLLRESTTAYFLGTSPALGAFMVAFRFAHVMRRIFGEGALVTGFIPHFETMRSTSARNAAAFFRDLLFSAALFLFLVVFFIEVGLFCFWQWAGLTQDTRQVLLLTMLTLPGLLFVCLSALSSGLIQCQGKFFLTGLAPILFNLAWVGTLWWHRSSPPSLTTLYLAIAISLSFLIQWLVLMPSVCVSLKGLITLKEWFKVSLFSKEIRQMLSAISLSILGVSAMQINSFLDALFARSACLEGPAYINYAIRIQQLPLALISIALSSALLPSLSREENPEAFGSLLRSSLSRAFSFILPCTLCIFLLGAGGISLIYQRGNFDATSALHTTACLWSYGIGLIPMSFVLLLSPAFYAKKDFWTPVQASLFSIGLNLILNVLLIFYFHLGAESVALATSACSFFNLWYLNQKLPIPLFKPLARPFFKIALSGFLAGAATFLFGIYLLQNPHFFLSFSPSFLSFAALSTIFLISFLLSAYLLKSEEILSLLRFRKDVRNETPTLPGL